MVSDVASEVIDFYLPNSETVAPELSACRPVVEIRAFQLD